MSRNTFPAMSRQTPLVASSNSGPLLVTPTTTSGTTAYLLTNTTGRNRSSATTTSVFAVGDTNYTGQDAIVCAVIGTSVGKKLKYGASYDDLGETVLNYVTKKYDYADELIGMFHNLEDPMEKYYSKYLPQKGMTITNKKERKDIWQTDVKEWRQQKGKVETCMVKTYVVIYGQCTEAMQLEIK
eukprot:2089555-Ditylum_brightwellii.AAC.1